MSERIGYGSSVRGALENSEPQASKADAWPEHSDAEQQQQAIVRMFKQLIDDSGSHPQEVRRPIDQFEQPARTPEADEGLGIGLDISV